ncbi:MAG: hypothetical protein WCD45_01335 [Gallionella sp.]
MRKILVCSLVALSVVGCASAPTGPRVVVMPAPGKPFEVFAEEDTVCRNFAQRSVGPSANDSAAESFLSSAALGTVIGAAAGSLSNGHGGSGAAVGLVGGSLVGAGQSGSSMHDSQRRYDIAYEQCMYAKGNQIPGFATQPQPRYAPPPAPAYAPPPPPAAPSGVPPDYNPPAK